ncbi:MAG: hypothetical protein KF760_07595 [Candidatus Eremiobacteraeota bacterium]|nr:hypothetical protein [Candidatus Eremiobacteraeota bacterium]MCW5871527.1 hypothetical protein [Candidatus Eremiobacteraeota bacterium]
MITLATRPQMVMEVSPASDSWQASWSAWRYPEEERGQGQGRSGGTAAQTGCTNLRTLLSSESLGEVWEAMLGQTSSQDLVIDSWTQLLRLN